MLQIYKRQDAISRQLNEPLRQERQRYLEDRAKQGFARSSLTRISVYLLIVVHGLRLTKKRDVSLAEIEAGAARWARRQSSLYGRSASWSEAKFRRYAVDWLSFLGWLKTGQSVRLLPVVAAYVRFLRNECGLCEETIRGRRRVVEQLLGQMRQHGHRLNRVSLADIDAMFLEKYQRGHYARDTVKLQATCLRSFFRYAEEHRLCRPGIAQGIQAARSYRLADLPFGPTWKDVRRLLKTSDGHDPKDIRDRAILLLLTVYGLRCGEVCRLLLSDLDWENETLTITHGKRGRRHTVPLTHPVGQAILRYLKNVRPRSEHRQVFLSMRAPIRPIMGAAIYHVVSSRMKPLNIKIAHHGPHCLRHACATRLINRGVPLEGIADQLGHESVETTRIYAKVDMHRLHEVAKVDLRGIL